MLIGLDHKLFLLIAYDDRTSLFNDINLIIFVLWWLYFKLSSLFVTQRVVLGFMVCCVKTLAAPIALTPQNVTVSPGSVTWAVWRAGSVRSVTRVRHVILHFVLFDKNVFLPIGQIQIYFWTGLWNCQTNP